MVIEIDPERVACESFIGFGAEWDVRNYRPMDVGDKEWDLIRERVEWMDIPAVRTMMQVKWVLRDDGSLDFESAQMRDLYRLLDICEELDATVFLADWGCMPDWLSVPQIDDVADPLYAETIGEYVEYLLDEKGYTCIDYFIMGNEPNLEVGDFDLWLKGVKNVAAEFEERGLDDRVTIAGPDETHREEWLERAASEASELFGAYDIHRYSSDDDVRPGGLRDHVDDLQNLLDQLDPNADEKPFVMGEAGLADDADMPSGNNRIDSFYYGLFMADYAVQAVNAGMAAVLCWMLDDNAHPGFFWGLWANTEEGMELRPWFACWGLLCRLFPAGCEILESPIDDEHLRLLTARTDDDDWTACLVNRGEDDIVETVRFGDEGGKATIETYRYEEGNTPTDDRGFPVPTDENRQSLDEVQITVPGESVAFLDVQS